MLKIKLILMAFCLCIAAVATFSFDEGLTQSDKEALDAYTHFAKQMKAGHAKPVKAGNDVFAKAGF